MNEILTLTELGTQGYLARIQGYLELCGVGKNCEACRVAKECSELYDRLAGNGKITPQIANTFMESHYKLLHPDPMLDSVLQLEKIKQDWRTASERYRKRKSQTNVI